MVISLMGDISKLGFGKLIKGLNVGAGIKPSNIYEDCELGSVGSH